jgi:polar amino acid transport system substrate-binding protein
VPTILVILLLSILTLTPASAMEEVKQSKVTEKVFIYIYHLKPPYIEQLDLESGLYFEIVELFNRFQSKYHFVPQFVPRKRLNREIEHASLDGMILGVHPIWFKDKEKTQFLWSKPLLHDQDEFISPRNRPFDYSGEQSLLQKNIGGVRGYHYFRIAPLLKTNQVKLTPTSSELQLLEMLIKQRLDVAVISRATLNYYFNKNPDWREQVYFSNIPHEQYYRALLSPKSLQAPFNIIKNVIEDEGFIAALNGLKLKYSFNDPVVHK